MSGIHHDCSDGLPPPILSSRKVKRAYAVRARTRIVHCKLHVPAAFGKPSCVPWKHARWRAIAGKFPNGLVEKGSIGGTSFDWCPTSIDDQGVVAWEYLPVFA